MSGYNTITVVGNLGRDPEFKDVGDGLAKFSVACGRRHKDRDTDEWVEETDWFNVSAWGWKASYVMDNLRKGEPVTVVGRMKSRRGEGRYEGRTFWEVDAQHVQAGKRRVKRDDDGDGRQNAGQGPARARFTTGLPHNEHPPPGDNDYRPGDPKDDPIPF